MGILLFGITPSELQLELAQKIVKEGMSTARAKVMVNKLIFEKGLKKSERHTPRKEFKKIQGFFERTGESLKILSEKSDDTLRKILMSRERDERNTLLKNAELVQRLSAQIRDFVRKAS